LSEFYKNGECRRVHQAKLPLQLPSQFLHQLPSRHMARGTKRALADDRTTKVSKDAWRKSLRLFKYIKPYRVLFGIGMLLLIATSLLSMVFPVLMGKLFDAEKGEGPIAFDALDLENIDTVAILLLLVFVAQALFGFGRIYSFSYVAEHMLANLRKDTYMHLLRMPMSFFSERRVGELNSRISADIALLQDTFTTVLAELLRQFIVIATGFVIIAWMSKTLTFTMLATIPVVAVIAVFFGRFIRKLSKQVQDRIAETNVIVDETMHGILNVKAFANEAWELVRYGKSVNEARSLAIKGARWRGAFVSFIILCMFGAIVFVIWRGVHLKEAGEIQEGQLITFILCTVFIGASIGSIPDLYATILKAVGATEHLMDLQDELQEEIDVDKRNTEHLNLKGDISFKQIDFTYPSRPDIPVLQNVSFQIRSGERVALVGPSGAGKSTIASLLLRFYQLNAGSILIDGQDIGAYNLSALRDRMAIVPQEVLLFGGTIRENIEYGKPGASDEELRNAAKKANALEFIDQFPEGLNTVVGERGIQLSGGQRQRIAIARAVLKDPAILILDEATSSLDTTSERLVQEALDELMKGRTSLVIAHRLSTIKNADRILVLRDGTVVGIGTHDELIADSDGLYHELSQNQFSA